MKALIVDDAAFMRAVMKRILTGMGSFEELAEAGNGAEAIKTYTAIKPDLVTMDVTMPEMDGITALKKILEVDPQAKIIVCSAMGQKDIVLEAIKAGAKHFIVKPIDEEKVVTTVSAILHA
ncbi:two-component system chemotaxis response regulator CheY [Hydrogenispora ethanolica]|jgi:two-component system chemotaxis response regulator CheY|uniref:Two-component system chemotaxis response regulator CheY n=1 Tax=Hydrogenispora ethanolica TaxID=1082276 RepID=A0A4R1RNC5_HYDET|nr:response regulator [Hydrogenispora ethanolica]TCL67410.1 two-component system chemotaxis response regulator CheY [Hydrogenispora ethanolica]